MATPYKMKGSPMTRNFGAPFKDDKKKGYTQKQKNAVAVGATAASGALAYGVGRYGASGRGLVDDGSKAVSKVFNTAKKYAKTGLNIVSKFGKGANVLGLVLGSTTTATGDQPKKGKGKKVYPGGKLDFTKKK